MGYPNTVLRWAIAAGLVGSTALAVFSSKAVMVHSAFILVLLSIAVERVLCRQPHQTARMPSLWYVRSHFVLLVCAAIPATFAQFGHVLVAGDSAICWPYPAIVVLTQLQGTPVWLAALGCSLVGNACLARISEDVPLPGRFGVLFSIAAVCTICIYVWPWALLYNYFSSAQVWFVYGANLMFMVLLGGGWLLLYRRASRFQSLAYATVLYGWLFTYAFPFFVIE